MKKAWWLIAVVISVVTQYKAKAQYVTIPDANFVTWLQNHGYSACLTGNQLDTTCPAVLNATTLSCNSSNISSVEGIQYFKNLVTFNCHTNQITTLPPLPVGLTDFGCAGNQIASLPALPAGLIWLSCKDNNLTSLPALPSGLKILYCYENQLTSLPDLPSSITDLYCYTNQLTSLPALPDSLKQLDCASNQIPALPALPAKLKHLQCQGNLLTELPVLPNGLNSLSCCCNQLAVLPDLPASITYIYCSHNQLTELPPLPPALGSLYCHWNQLTWLPPLPSTLVTLHCTNNQLTWLPELPAVMNLLLVANNPGITCLPPIEKLNESVWGWSSSIAGTGITCLPNIIQHPGSIPSIDTLPVCDMFNANGCPLGWNISGKIYRDGNDNCVLDDNEPKVKNIKVQLLQNGSVLQQVVSSIGGSVSFNTNLGTYQTRVDTTGLPFSVACPSSNSLTSVITASDSLDYQANFGLKCKNGYDLSVNGITQTSGMFFPGQQAKVIIQAGDLVQYYVAQCNPVVLGGTVAATFTGPVTVSAISGNGLVAGSTVTWNVSDFSQIDFLHAFNITFVTDTLAQAGSQVCVNVTITGNSGTDNLLSNDTLQHCFTVINSYDPNMKEVFPATASQPGEFLTYTVHFQNTGTAPAQNIRIIDTLSTHLDWSSFQLLAYSHNNLTQVKQNGIVHFNFPNIQLPDSTNNEPDSHGYIQYKIKTKPDIPPGTAIHNTASIYFDFNAPVKTNDASVLYCVPQNVEQNFQICAGDSVEIGGAFYNQAGIYTNAYTSSTGCDSVVTTSLALLQPSSSQQTFSICEGDSVQVDGNWYGTAETFTVLMPNASGCDSLITTTIGVAAASSFDQSFELCPGESVTVNGNVYATAGLFTDVLINSAGCDSFVNTNITTHTTIVQTPLVNLATLTIAADAVSYQWYNCETNLLISGATSASYTAPASGSYRVDIVDSNGCSAASECVQVIVTDVENVRLYNVMLYPNPAANEVIVLCKDCNGSTHLQLTDLTGKILFSTIAEERTVVSLSDVVAGSYIVRLMQNGKTLSFRNLTVIK